MTTIEILVLVCCFFGAATVILIALWYFLRRRWKLQSSEEDDVTYYSASKESAFEEPACKKMSIKDIYAATNNLSPLNFIGQGIAGKVYKGILLNGWHVAVKHIIKDEYAETFIREVTSLSHVRHPNLVLLRGYCEEAYEYFLVYELCINGNLSEWIFGKDKTLSWIQRLQIALDSACGPGGCIVHRDITPTNILLGANFEAKLSDFGLSKCIDNGVSHISSEVRGTFGYVDPEYRQNHHVNAAGDAKLLTRGGNISEFVDPKLNGEYSTEAFDLTLKLALSCTGHKQQRPSMERVVEKALEISTRANESCNLSIVESQTISF